jgi:hypothetical protein
VPLDLSRPRDLGTLLGTAWETWLRSFAVFFALALLVVAPITIVFDGILAGRLADPEATAGFEAEGSNTFVSAVLMPALVTALHVVVVLELARGERPGVGESLRRVLPFVPLVIVTVLLYALGTAIGLVLLIVPGIWFAVRCYFGAQAVIVDGLGPVAALRRSSELVRGSWWRVFGYLIVIGLIAAALGLVAGFIVGGIGAATGSGLLYIIGITLGTAVAQSYTALAATLLFFDLRARQGTTASPETPGTPGSPGSPAAPGEPGSRGAPGSGSLDSPERPV